jgi:phosphate transport system permease protein
VVIPLKGYSALAGSVALAIMMLPLIVRSTEETMNLLPASLKEAGLALGSPYRSVVLKVLLPSAFGGVFTGILLAVSRVIGETAPLMLTALGATTIQWDITKPASAVSLLIWEFYNDPNLQSMIWSASLFLLLLVLSLNILAKQLAKKWRI